MLEGEPALGGTKIGIHPQSPLCRFCTSPRAFCRPEVKEQRPAEAGPAGTWWRSRKAELVGTRELGTCTGAARLNLMTAS